MAALLSNVLPRLASDDVAHRKIAPGLKGEPPCVVNALAHGLDLSVCVGNHNRTSRRAYLLNEQLKDLHLLTDGEVVGGDVPHRCSRHGILLFPNPQSMSVIAVDEVLSLPGHGFGDELVDMCHALKVGSSLDIYRLELCVSVSVDVASLLWCGLRSV